MGARAIMFYAYVLCPTATVDCPHAPPSTAAFNPEEHRMKFGVTFPQTEIGADPIAIRDYAQAVEGAGFDYMIAFDHVTGAHPDRFAEAGDPNVPPNPYLYKDEFHEPFVLYAWLAAQTTTLEFACS